MCLAHGVAGPSGEGHGFFVVHGHAGRSGHVLGGAQRVRLAVRLRVDEMTHLHGSQRLSRDLRLSLSWRVEASHVFSAPVDVFFRVQMSSRPKAKPGFQAQPRGPRCPPE